MKRIVVALLLLLILCMALSGCDFWMDGQYVSVEPYSEQNFRPEKDMIEVSSSAQLRQAVVDLVESGARSGIISVASFNDATVHFYMEGAIRNVTQNNPIGAYAVDSITYEIGVYSGVDAVALTIHYRYDGDQVMHIKSAQTVGEAEDHVYAALEKFEPSVAVLIQEYQQTDFEYLVQEYAAKNPDIVIEIPRVEANLYPEKGQQRVVELVFTYQTSRENLRQMQELVAPVFTSAELYVQPDAQLREKYVQLYNFLMERFDYSLETTITPAYSLLHEGVGDCTAFATVYAAMCRKAGLECHVVSGTREGEPWSWNLVYFMGNYFHVDLLFCSQTGGFAASLGSEMTDYEWDYSAYPSR